ncbi:hypothetical protein [Thermosediminibacter oceani]|uniref:Uncharacterized protein n=1 Tax=Thermosediminibacter oceani (strain ATCC BAA-1034 / DSM 16646 / JW/IW-1228P) TaxID=555079 RepID=D9S2X6_THEOJ|nr:hypothetical protein [Thermosediminibacter oceani]ADL07753.1 hypothetical protein Toce_0991 [Thermosediminibacter oceani DSM 16646]
MELKELLGEELFNQVMAKVGDHKIDIVSNGQWIPKSKFDEVITEKNQYKAQVEKLSKYKPVEKSDAEKALEEREKALFQKEVELILKEHGLEDFKDFFVVNSIDELKPKIEAFKKILDSQKLNNSYKPSDHKNNDAYSRYASEKNAVGMIGAKLSKLFS